MKFLVKFSPNYRDEDHSTVRIMSELLVGLLAVFAFSMIYYYVEYDIDYVLHGFGLILISALVAFITEAVYSFVIKKSLKSHIKNSFPFVTSVILVLSLPISTSFYAIAVATFFAIFIGKLVFGGFGQNIFNPAGVGRAVLVSSLAGSVVADVTTSATPISSIASAGWLIKDQESIRMFLEQFGGLKNLFLGWYPGAMGETSVILILLVGIYLAYRKVLDWKIPVTYIGSVFIFTSIIAVYHGIGIWYPLFHILSGGLMFGAVFMMTDPVTSPTSRTGKIIFSIGAAVLTVIIRLQANLPGGVIYSILIMNLLTPLIESITDKWSIYNVKLYRNSIIATFILGIFITFFAAMPLEAKSFEVEAPKGEVVVGEDSPLGTPIKVFKGDLSEDVVIKDTSEDGDEVTYNVEVPGYAVAEGGQPNLIEVKLNKSDKKVISVNILESNDTEGLGTKINAGNFLDQFKEVAFDDKDKEVDSVSAATVSSESVALAVEKAVSELE